MAKKASNYAKRVVADTAADKKAHRDSPSKRTISDSRKMQSASGDKPTAGKARRTPVG